MKASIFLEVCEVSLGWRCQQKYRQRDRKMFHVKGLNITAAPQRCAETTNPVHSRDTDNEQAELVIENETDR